MIGTKLRLSVQKSCSIICKLPIPSNYLPEGCLPSSAVWQTLSSSLNALTGCQGPNMSTTIANQSKSQAAFEQAKQLIPGGVNSPARAFGAVGGEPIFIDRAEGSHLYDIDGNRYLDYVGSWGPMIFGHAFQPVVDATTKAIAGSTSFGAPTEGENRLAELIIELVPSVERVRLVNSGTEATMSALRLARGLRGVTALSNLLAITMAMLIAFLSLLAVQRQLCLFRILQGVTAGTAADTIVLPYNDHGALVKTFAEQGDQIAGIIFEPVCGNMGVVVPSDDFLKALREQTTKHGALLICDEVMTGFRLSSGGAQKLLGIEPDITTLGKIVGGGLPVGAYGGRSDIMGHILPEGPVFQAGTLSGNPLATSAGIATLQALRDTPPYKKIEQLSARLAEGLDEVSKSAGVPHVVQRVGSMTTLFFHEGPVDSWYDAAKCDTDAFAKFFWGMLRRGVYLPCSQYEAMFVSASHTEEEIDQTIMAAKESLAELNA